MPYAQPTWLTDVLDGLPDTPRLATLGEHHDALEDVRGRYPNRVRRARVGTSAEGRPIFLYSVGNGHRSSLVVGGPHPNEPSGVLSVQFLLELIASEPSLDTVLDSTWHFIGCIDPDGHVRNEGWMTPPRTPSQYLTHFFRPALADQPEYSFPLSVDGYTFDQSTPENQAWQAALALARPDIQVSLHNAELGGAFFLLTHRSEALMRWLGDLPERFGITLSGLGEPFSDLKSAAKGIFELPDIASIIQAGGGAGQEVWPAGNSSAGFARRYDTRSLVPEAPLWDHPGLRDHRPGSLTLRDVVAEHCAWLQKSVGTMQALLAGFAPELPRVSPRVCRSLNESMLHIRRQRDQLTRLLSSDGVAATERVPECDGLSMRLQLRLASLRGPAMLAQCAAQLQCAQAHQGAKRLVEDGCRSLTPISELQPVSLRSAVGIQSGATLALAAFTAM